MIVEDGFLTNESNTSLGGVGSTEVVISSQYASIDHKKVYKVTGNVSLSGNPSIVPGNFENQEINLIGVSGDFTVTLNNNYGVVLTTPSLTLTHATLAVFRWNDTLNTWIPISIITVNN